MNDAFELSSRLPLVLIADDDPAIVRMLADGCARVGFAVETATNGLQALIKASRNHPDVVIIDVNMPEADGLTVCARLLDPIKESLSVIVVTGSRLQEIVERCEGFGAFYVRKGSGFWNGLASALTDIFPRMTNQIDKLRDPRRGAEVPERPRVLLIDDDVEVKEFLASRLDQCGVELLHALDTGLGYRMACKETPSVIISDYFMPNGGIPYLLSRLRTTTATENIPLFALTGRNLDEITTKSLTHEIYGKPGAARVFRKSFDIEELFGALEKLCGFEYNRVAG